jgi:hypothetical protein
MKGDCDALYAGLDCHFNDETDLNFNLSHAALGHALQKRTAKIYFDKRRMRSGLRSCDPEPLYVFAGAAVP